MSPKIQISTNKIDELTNSFHFIQNQSILSDNLTKLHNPADTNSTNHQDLNISKSESSSPSKIEKIGIKMEKIPLNQKFQKKTMFSTKSNSKSKNQTQTISSKNLMIKTNLSTQ
jgi:hypothetical protein